MPSRDAAAAPLSPSPGLRKGALAALCQSDPQAKVEATHALWSALTALADEAARKHALSPGTAMASPSQALPGRPQRPPLVPPTEVPHRSPFTDEGLAALLHAVCHIEFNAINLALDAVWRFAGMPLDFYRDWLRVADEEATHFTLLRTHLLSLGHDYGDCPAHDGLWEMCVKTQDDITARMALVPRTLEARGLDATPLIQARLRKVGTPAALRAVEILEVILRDEIGHVAIGNRWYGWLCERQQLDPIAHYRQLARTHSAPRLKPPFNEAARRAAGFSQQELDYLLGA
ncbi:ferritin-like domain-containing protein [Hydrogenophaga sp. RWCD_12]|uniref:ferritin-like domain-containing protein n=1 Tax=Hydrogenophaga sp. RWCD_12 TaxID=3391190 RepID=UPI003984F1CA